MRNLLTTAIASLALTTLLIGSASAAGWATQPSSGNAAEQATLERDAADHWTRRGGEGVIVSNDSPSSPSLSQADQSYSTEQGKPWLRRSPAGEIVSQPNNAAGQQGHMMND